MLTQELHVLIVGTEILSLHLLDEALSHDGCSCEVALSRERALEIAQRREIHVALCDVPMGGVDNFELLESIEAINPKLPVIVGTTRGSVPEAVEAR